VPDSPSPPEYLRIDALAIEDALAVSASPGSLLLELHDVEVLEVANRHPIHARTKVLAAGPRNSSNGTPPPPRPGSSTVPTTC
jgi:hypothetical protein